MALDDTAGSPDTGLDLVGPFEVAERAGVSRSTVSQWRRRHETFPAPVAHLGAGRRAPRGEASEGTAVWRWADVAEWLVLTGRDRPGLTRTR